MIEKLEGGLHFQGSANCLIHPSCPSARGSRHLESNNGEVVAQTEASFDGWSSGMLSRFTGIVKKYMQTHLEQIGEQPAMKADCQQDVNL